MPYINIMSGINYRQYLKIDKKEIKTVNLRENDLYELINSKVEFRYNLTEFYVDIDLSRAQFHFLIMDVMNVGFRDSIRMSENECQFKMMLKNGIGNITIRTQKY